MPLSPTPPKARVWIEQWKKASFTVAPPEVILFSTRGGEC